MGFRTHLDINHYKYKAHTEKQRQSATTCILSPLSLSLSPPVLLLLFTFLFLLLCLSLCLSSLSPLVSLSLSEVIQPESLFRDLLQLRESRVIWFSPTKPYVQMATQYSPGSSPTSLLPQEGEDVSSQSGPPAEWQPSMGKMTERYSCAIEWSLPGEPNPLKWGLEAIREEI